MDIRRYAPTALGDLPVTLAEAKAFLRVDGTDDDTLIAELIASANNTVADLGWMTCRMTTWELVLPGFPEVCGSRVGRKTAQVIRLPRGPVRALKLITYIDPTGEVIVMLPATCQISITEDDCLVAPLPGESWPSVQADNLEPVVVRYEAGFDDEIEGQEFPPELKQAVKMVVAHWYESRESVLVGTISKEVELGVSLLCRNLGFWRFDPGR